MMRKNLLFTLIFALLSPFFVHSQSVAVKTNLLYGAIAYAPNLSAEVELSDFTTLSFGAGYNGWRLNDNSVENKKLVHWVADVEFRAWTCCTYYGHFFGAHAIGGQYNISRHNLPLLFHRNSSQYRFQGFAVGGGLSYGYHWNLTDCLNLEATIGAGYMRLNYDKYLSFNCGKQVDSVKRNYWGPTKLGISLCYLF